MGWKVVEENNGSPTQTDSKWSVVESNDTPVVPEVNPASSSYSDVLSRATNTGVGNAVNFAKRVPLLSALYPSEQSDLLGNPTNVSPVSLTARSVALSPLRTIASLALSKAMQTRPAQNIVSSVQNRMGENPILPGDIMGTSQRVLSKLPKGVFGGIADMAVSSLPFSNPQNIINKISGKVPEEEVNKLIIDSYKRSIKPTAKGQSLSKYANKDSAIVNSVKNIVQNTRESGLPQSVSDLAKANDSAMDNLYTKYNDIAIQSTGAGAKFDSNDLVNKVNASIANKNYSLKSRLYIVRNILPELQDLNGANPIEVQNRIKELNSSLDGYYHGSGVTKPQAEIDASVASLLRKKLDALIESSTGEQYQAVKKQYGYHREVSSEINKRAEQIAQKRGSAMGDLVDIFSGERIVRGLIFAEPKYIVEGLTWGALKKVVKELHNPDRRIRDMFRYAERYTPKVTPAPDISSPPMAQITNQSAPQDLIPQSVRKLLTGPYSASGEGFTVKNLSDAQLEGLRRQMEFKRNFEMPMGESRGTMNPSQIKYKNIVDEILARRARNFPNK